ncbi:MAG: adenylate/guanylate cyclase domain-containing protein [Pseudonocardiales bacterium]
MKFCGSCVTAIGSPAPAAESRKTVTAVFCDVTGSTVLGQRLDPESLRTVMESYFAAVSAVLRRHGGTVEKFIGDAVMAVFGVPVAHEDDALRACRAAVELQAAVREVDAQVVVTHGVRFQVRVGIETGEVLVGDPARGSTFAAGAPVNMAARLEQAAGPGECLLGEQCYRLVRDAVDVQPRPGLTLKGVAGDVTAYQLGRIRSEPAGDRMQAALVGRVRELALLEQALERARTDRTCQLATVLGPAGVGKSRLAAEFVADCADTVTVLSGRCVSYGEGVTYWPLVEVVRQAAGLTGGEPPQAARARVAALVEGDPDAAQVVDRIAAVAGLGGVPGSVVESAWALQRLLDVLAMARPVVLILDDLHWAEPGLVEIVESVCDWSRDAPILIVVMARPEFFDSFPGWGAGRVNSVSAMLEPLRDEEVDQLARELLGATLPDEVSDRVRTAAGGNPLFVEQLLAMLVEEGSLRRDRDRWVPTVDLSRLAVPPTIAALLNARLDLLTGGERAVLGPAAVIGQVFYRGPLAELAQRPAAEVDTHLKALVRKGLFRRADTDLPGQEALRFGHVMVREAAYGTLPKAARAALHERFARWLDKNTEGQAYDDFVGEHLEQAYRNRVDLGALDDAARQLGDEAAERLAAAGRLLTHADEAAACGLLERASRLRTDDGPRLWGLLLDLTDALTEAGRFDEAAATVRAIRGAADAAADQRWSQVASLVQAQMRQYTDPEGATEALRQEAARALPLFEALRDHEGLSRAHEALSRVQWMASRSGEQSRHLQAAAEEAALAGRAQRAEDLRRRILDLLITGDCPAAAGLAASESALAGATDRHRKGHAAAAVAFFGTLLGRPEVAGPAKETAERLAHEVRSPQAIVQVSLIIGAAELSAGRLEEALRLLDQACRELTAVGYLSVLSSAAALHAHALLQAGLLAAARERVATALEMGSSDDAITQGLAAAASAWLAAVDANPAAIEAHTAAAVAYLSGADDLESVGLAHVASAEAATITGDSPAASLHRQAAIDAFLAKGNEVAVRRQRALLEPLG